MKQFIVGVFNEMSLKGKVCTIILVIMCLAAAAITASTSYYKTQQTPIGRGLDYGVYQEGPLDFIMFSVEPNVSDAELRFMLEEVITLRHTRVEHIVVGLPPGWGTVLGGTYE